MSTVDDPVLILNSNWACTAWLPVGVAITTCLRDMGSVLDPDTYMLYGWDEWVSEPRTVERYVKTSRGPLPAPDIVVLKKFGARPPRKIGLNRPNVGRRDDWHCQYCGAPLEGNRKLTLDHVKPRSRGGQSSWDNIVAACGPCNQRKADREPAEAGMKLKKMPRKPSWNTHLKLPRRKKILASWEPFLEKEGIL